MKLELLSKKTNYILLLTWSLISCSCCCKRLRSLSDVSRLPLFIRPPCTGAGGAKTKTARQCYIYIYDILLKDFWTRLLVFKAIFFYLFYIFLWERGVQTTLYPLSKIFLLPFLFPVSLTFNNKNSDQCSHCVLPKC